MKRYCTGDTRITNDWTSRKRHHPRNGAKTLLVAKTMPLHIQYVAGCTTCQQNKINTHPTQPLTQPIKSTAMKPFQMITQDFISGLPKTKKGHDCIMVMVDHGLMKGVIFIPCSKEITALEATELHFNHTFKLFGILEIIISNRDPLFVSKTYRGLMKLCRIKQ